MQQVDHSFVFFEVQQKVQEQVLQLNRNVHFELYGLSHTLQDNVEKFFFGDEFLLTEGVKDITEQVNQVDDLGLWIEI